jgi:hypothetical protein
VAISLLVIDIKYIKIYNFHLTKLLFINHLGNCMQTIVLNVQDSVNDKFLWLLEHFSKNEIEIVDKYKATDDDTYLRSIDGMVESITEARKEPIENGVSLDKLEW